MIISRIICLAIGYIFGIFQTGYLYGKTKNIDIRQHGSGNAGTTNTMRTLGKKAGVITFLGDLFKAIIAVLIVWMIFKDRYPEYIGLLKLYAGLGAVLGHNYPFYLQFKGGKGIASTAGVILSCCPSIAPICILLFAGAVVFTKYVSLGSILAAIGFMSQMVIFTELGIVAWGEASLVEVYIVAGVFTAMALWRHRANMVRLVKGTENKVGAKKKETN